uniref:Putative secreted peptide n=1 Tax=Anopheles braziliensis TaxID=58242 RepID=A0A2M3ZWZ1_9DIPT
MVRVLACLIVELVLRWFAYLGQHPGNIANDDCAECVPLDFRKYELPVAGGAFILRTTDLRHSLGSTVSVPH